MPDVLQHLSVRTSWYGGEQGDVRQVLHWVEDSWQQDQVPLIKLN